LLLAHDADFVQALRRECQSLRARSRMARLIARLIARIRRQRQG
jgi:hypothetical protein